MLDKLDFPAEQEPDGDVSLPHHFYLGIIAAVYGFAFVWPTYPATGAAVTVVGALVLLDDVVSHAFGVWTPLDWAFKKWVRPLAPK